jgi:hypothetical protein
MTIAIILIAAALLGVWLLKRFLKTPAEKAAEKLAASVTSNEANGGAFHSIKASAIATNELVARARKGDFVIYAYPGKAGRVAIKTDRFKALGSSVTLRNPRMLKASDTLTADSFWLTNGSNGNWLPDASAGEVLGAALFGTKITSFIDGRKVSNAINERGSMQKALERHGGLVVDGPERLAPLTEAQSASWYRQPSKEESRAASRARNARRGAAGASAQAALEVLWAAQDAAETKAL